MRTISFLLLFTTFSVSAQINDNFSDGSFTQNPEWIGDIDNFKINKHYQLQLYDNKEGSSYLSTKNVMINIDNTQWKFWVRLSFQPSDNNHPRIYLTSNQSNLEKELNGYFIQIGKSGSDKKRIYFFRQDGDEKHLIMEGNYNLADSDNNLLTIKTTRDNQGNWSIKADNKGSGLFIPQGNVFDNTYSSTKWFGFFCNYTTTNSDRFYFDEIYVGEIIPDTTNFDVKYSLPFNSVTLDVFFNKTVDKNSSENISNYLVEGIGNPVLAERLNSNPNIVRLLFAEEFELEKEYNINISNIIDYSTQHNISNYSGTFQYYNPKPYDVVFNELMANPTPVVGLDPYRYIELFNTTDYYININGWFFKSGNDNPNELPIGVIPPQDYLILVRQNDLPYFSDYKNVVAADLGFHYLTTGGRTIVLLDANGEVIHAISYNEEWYKDPSKKDGGWSLEQIDPYNPCGGINNWQASNNNKGGTPGIKNSTYSNNPDTTNPYLIRAAYIDPFNIRLVFNEPMYKNSLLSKSSYIIDNEIGNPSSITPLKPDFRKVQLLLPTELKKDKTYNIEVTDILTDCAGNNLRKNRNFAKIAIPELADSNDIVINEILFNPPEATSQRYIEIYNRSRKVIDLKHYTISSKDTITNILTSVSEITEESYLFFPGDYVVLTTNPESVKNFYYTNNPDGFIKITSMPSMANSGGIAVLAHKSQKIIDKVIYSEDMHYPLLFDKKGVALERLSYDRPSNTKHNWHSAAQNVNFGTPGYKNSQFTYKPDKFNAEITVEPEFFSPNNDGKDDILNIYLKFDKPGNTANIKVFDSRGRFIKHLARSKLLGTEDVITWDGSDNNNQRASIGIYVIFIEIFDTNGNVRTYKKSAVLAGHL